MLPNKKPVVGLMLIPKPLWIYLKPVKAYPLTGLVGFTLLSGEAEQRLSSTHLNVSDSYWDGARLIRRKLTNLPFDEKADLSMCAAPDGD